MHPPFARPRQSAALPMDSQNSGHAKEEETPICPMPPLTLRQSFPMSVPMASPTTRATTDVPCPGPPSLPARWTFVPFRPAEHSRKLARCSSLPEIGKILRRVRSDGCPTCGASVAARIEVQLKKRLERTAEALAQASDKSEFVLLDGARALPPCQSRNRQPHPGRARLRPGRAHRARQEHARHTRPLGRDGARPSPGEPPGHASARPTPRGCGFQPRHGLGPAAQDLLNKHRPTSGGAASSRAAGCEITENTGFFACFPSPSPPAGGPPAPPESTRVPVSLQTRPKTIPLDRLPPSPPSSPRQARTGTLPPLRTTGKNG